MEANKINVLIKEWKEYYPDDFLEAVGEIHQGNSIEAFYLFKNFVETVDSRITVDKVNKFKIYATILTEESENHLERM